MTNSIAWALIVAAAINSTLGNIFLKNASVDGQGLFAMVFNPWFIAGLMCYSINVLLFAKALEILPVSTAYPVLAGVGFLILTVASNYFFGESMNLNKLSGMVLILAGIFLMT